LYLGSSIFVGTMAYAHCGRHLDGTKAHMKYLSLTPLYLNCSISNSKMEHKYYIN
jgi:hypothetical protein